MTTYYKGELFLKKNIRNIYKRTIIFEYQFTKNITDMLNEKEIELLKKFFWGKIGKDILEDTFTIQDKSIIELLFKSCQFYYTDEIKIIYEKLKDKNGRQYAKELHTGLIFPIFSEYNDFSLNCKSEGRYTNISFNEVSHPNYDMLKCYCNEIEVADNNEIKKYLDISKAKFKTKKYFKLFKEMINTLYNQNVLSKEINFADKVVPTFEHKSEEIESMENIEYLLSILKDTNPELYTKYNNEYEKLLNSNDSFTLSPLNLSSLVTLEASIELSLNLSKRNADNILDYLNSLIEEYLNNFLTNNGKTTGITLTDLDNINKSFLRSQSNYNIQTGRIILRKLALIFIFEVKENISSITEEDLNNSYFSQNIKSILISLKSLLSLEIVRVNMPVDLVYNLSVSNVLELIKSIEFNTFDKEKTNELIKQLKN